jgi:hypothetical protein
MNVFRLDLNRLVRLILPILFRKTVMLSFLDAITQPVSNIYNLFLINRDSNLYNLSISPQVCSLQKLLNDRFDISQRRIFITDGVFYNPIYIHTAGENINLYLYTASEKRDISLYMDIETGSLTVDFFINVPFGLQFDVEEMKALIDYYKLASKTYKINQI